MFEFFFKYSAYVYDKGEFVFAAGWPAIVATVVLAVAAVPAILRYSGVRGKSSQLDRLVLLTTRLCILSIILVLLLQPSLAVSTAVPQENFVGIILDDSQSMQLADYGDEKLAPRSDFIHEFFGNDNSKLMMALNERFKLRFFRFSDSAYAPREPQ